MLRLQKIINKVVVEEIKSAYRENFALLGQDYAEKLDWFCHLALENLGTCNALYHNVEHTIMVVSAGLEILRGKQMREGNVSAEDFYLSAIALLCHDIGYVRGICTADHNNRYATGVGDEMVALPPGATDAALAPYHVDRGKMFVQESLGQHGLLTEEAMAVVMEHIEMTRFPIPSDPSYQNTRSFSALVRAADLIGQMGDPGYLRKLPALFYELEETGANAKIGYADPEDMQKKYAKFFWYVINPYIQEGLKYLRVTQEGRQWVSNLHAHVFTVEHGEL